MVRATPLFKSARASSAPLFLSQRKTDVAEECLGFLFIFRCCRDSYRKSENILTLFIGGFWKDDVLSNAEGEISHFIYDLRAYAAEILCTRQNYVNQLIKEGLLARAAKRDLVSNNVSRANLESRDRLFCRALRRCLTCDPREPIFYKFALFWIILRGHAGRNYNFLNSRRLHGAFVSHVGF